MKGLFSIYFKTGWRIRMFQLELCWQSLFHHTCLTTHAIEGLIAFLRRGKTMNPKKAKRIILLIWNVEALLKQSVRKESGHTLQLCFTTLFTSSTWILKKSNTIDIGSILTGGLTSLNPEGILMVMLYSSKVGVSSWFPNMKVDVLGHHNCDIACMAPHWISISRRGISWLNFDST